MFHAVLIDDEPYTLEDMRASFPFSKYAFTVTGMYTSAEEALGPVLSDPPDLIITDIRMQACSGLELTQILRRNSVQSLIVLLSAYQDFAYVQEAFRQGVFYYMLKPIDDMQAGEVIRRASQALKEHPPERKRKYSDDALGKALEYIENNYTSSLQVEDVAAMLYINKNYLSDLFSRRLGVTFTQYRHSLRIQDAKRRLAQTEEGIADIAYAVGYNSESYFWSIFKRITGKTPQQYRSEMMARAESQPSETLQKTDLRP